MKSWGALKPGASSHRRRQAAKRALAPRRDPRLALALPRQRSPRPVSSGQLDASCSFKMLDLEDSVSLGAPAADAGGEEVTQQPAKRLGRLRKAAEVQDKENATANAAPAEDSPPRPAASEQQASERPEAGDEDAEAPASPVLAPAASGDDGTEAAAAPSPGGQVRCLRLRRASRDAAALRLASHLCPHISNRRRRATSTRRTSWRSGLRGAGRAAPPPAAPPPRPPRPTVSCGSQQAGCEGAMRGSEPERHASPTVPPPSCCRRGRRGGGGGQRCQRRRGGGRLRRQHGQPTRLPRHCRAAGRRHAAHPAGCADGGWVASRLGPASLAGCLQLSPAAAAAAAAERPRGLLERHLCDAPSPTRPPPCPAPQRRQHVTGWARATRSRSSRCPPSWGASRSGRRWPSRGARRQGRVAGPGAGAGGLGGLECGP